MAKDWYDDVFEMWSSNVYLGITFRRMLVSNVFKVRIVMKRKVKGPQV